jgi:surfeit locus 1 family protein
MRAGVAEERRPDPGSRHPFRFTGRGIAAAAFVLVIAAVCIRLGFWQLDRQEQRDELNRALAAALQEPPLDLGAAEMEAVLADPEAHLYRRVRVEGTFDASREVVLRGRALDGNPGVNLVTPLLLREGSVAVLVNRGWVRSPDASTVDPEAHAEPGLRVVEGVLQPLPRGGDTREAVLEVNGRPVRTAMRLDGSDPRFTGTATLFPLLVQQVGTGSDPGTVGTPTRLPAPRIDRGPHLGYAVQWFSFAAIAVLGFGLMLHLSRTTRL